MMRFVFLFVCLFQFFTTSAQWEKAIQKLQQTKGLEHATFGISVKRVADGGVVLNYGAEKSMTPASVVKLLSTALALKQHGPEFAYTTGVAYSGVIREGVLMGNLVVQAGGDPAVHSVYFPGCRLIDSIVSCLKTRGIRRIDGRVLVEERVPRSHIPGSWPWEDVANYYGALYHAFNYCDNTYIMRLQTRKKDSVAEIISVHPRIPRVEFLNRVVVDPLKPNDVWLYGGPYAEKIEIRGTLSGNPAIYTEKGAIHHPSEVFVQELTECLQADSIFVEGEGIPSDSLTALFSFSSPALKDIVFYTNKKSVNLFSEALGRLVDQESFERGVKRCLTAMALDTSGIILKDACGLSPSNAVPAERFTDLLVWGHRHLDRSFFSSLPEGGVDGGLQIYSAHPFLGSRLRAKTGSLSGIRALSGYLRTQNNELLAFTIMVNHYTCRSKVVQEAIRDFLVELTKPLAVQ